ncbi:hypothetical protein HPB49_013107 [Dermacentor silvarum]|uniref:Uncharacterized protein n=1 Tax=Dermacentor silvarum TaxID=543639 RepID=A0ACB8D5N2_DERSI|nr:hypothetical protein HPB49_013107 [Dermacentor silvarum]
MACCLVSWLLYTAVSWLVAFAAWFKLADADLTLLFKSKFGLSIATLRGKVIWITGASSGIGEYLAYELAKVGSRLILSGTNLENLELVKNNCIEFGKDKGTEVLVLPFSICDFSSHSEQLQKVLDHFGKVCISLPYSYLAFTGVCVEGYYECLRMEGVILGGLHVTITCPGPVFSRIRERALTATPGKLYNKKDTPNARLMPTERCAQLIAVAIANKMDEVWISQNPILLLVYLAQYMPSIFRNYVVKLLFTEDRVRKMREGQ